MSKSFEEYAEILENYILEDWEEFKDYNIKINVSEFNKK